MSKKYNFKNRIGINFEIKTMKTKFNPIIYLLFVAYGIFSLATKNLDNSLIYLGIALAIDPFDTSQPFNERPIWQKAVLIVQLSIVFGLILIRIFFPEDF